MWAWANPLDDGARRTREDYDYPPELRYYRIIALTHYTDEEYRAIPEKTLNELYMMDEIVRDADRRLQAKVTANELALVLAPMFAAR